MPQPIAGDAEYPRVAAMAATPFHCCASAALEGINIAANIAAMVVAFVMAFTLEGQPTPECLRDIAVAGTGAGYLS